MIGSSLVRGMGMRFGKLLGNTLVHSLSGARLPKMLKLVEQTFGDGELQPNTISLVIAGNDTMTKCPMSVILKNYSKVLDYLHEKVPKAKIFVCYIPPTRDNITNTRLNILNSWLYQQSAEREYVCTASPSSMDKSHYQDDYIHYNKKGRNHFVDSLASSIQNFRRPAALAL